MAVIGHYVNLDAAQKLTQAHLVAGVIEEDVKRGNPLEFTPLAIAEGQSIKWNRESVVGEGTEFEIGEELVFTAEQDYSTQEVELKRIYKMTRLDKFVTEVYGTINNYEELTAMELRKGCVRTLGDRFFYGDITYGGAKQFDGLHALAALNTGTDLDIDNAEAGLLVHNLRKMIHAMKHGCDALFFPTEIYRRMTEAYEEGGLVTLASGTAGHMAAFSIDRNQIGKGLAYFDGIPIIMTDYLVAENANTGEGANIRAKWTAGDKQYSIFGVKWGDITMGQPGLCLGMGGTGMGGDLFRLDYFPFSVIPNYDGPAMRLITYTAPLMGSTMSVGRIFDIEDVALT